VETCQEENYDFKPLLTAKRKKQLFDLLKRSHVQPSEHKQNA